MGPRGRARLVFREVCGPRRRSVVWFGGGLLGVLVGSGYFNANSKFKSINWRRAREARVYEPRLGRAESHPSYGSSASCLSKRALLLLAPVVRGWMSLTRALTRGRARVPLATARSVGPWNSRERPRGRRRPRRHRPRDGTGDGGGHAREQGAHLGIPPALLARCASLRALAYVTAAGIEVASIADDGETLVRDTRVVVPLGADDPAVDPAAVVALDWTTVAGASSARRRRRDARGVDPHRAACAVVRRDASGRLTVEGVRAMPPTPPARPRATPDPPRPRPPDPRVSHPPRRRHPQRRRRARRRRPIRRHPRARRRPEIRRRARCVRVGGPPRVGRRPQRRRRRPRARVPNRDRARRLELSEPRSGGAGMKTGTNVTVRGDDRRRRLGARRDRFVARSSTPRDPFAPSSPSVDGPSPRQIDPWRYRRRRRRRSTSPSRPAPAGSTIPTIPTIPTPTEPEREMTARRRRGDVRSPRRVFRTGTG